ncbi:MAG: transketolase [Actinobacteria bacterium HGW-Actinobacteria-10]|jgi:transketolase|nr:MAG: transketolase [Actinobacteria bacterium HGW-Actinobacteria-10]
MSKRATREAFGATLVELAADGIDVVAVEADLSKSTTTATFARSYPDRFFNAGIAEQNMVGTAAGLAVAGKVAFTGSFAVFATGRAYDQVRNTVCYSRLNVKLAPTHSGITVGPDGGSHQMLEDLALMRVLPGMHVLVPADYNAAAAAIRLAARTPGPFYIRLGRTGVPQVYDEGFEMQLGRANVLRQGEDITVAACGIMVAEALTAADALAAEGVSVEVVDVSSIKPLDSATVLASVAKTRRMITAEEHSVIGGLGSAIAELLGEHDPVPLKRIGVNDVFGTSGEPDELMAHFGLTASDISKAVRELLS